jgi:hypothetical protein
LKISVVVALALACTSPAAAYADVHSASIVDPLEQPCYPHSICTPDIAAASASYDPVAASLDVSVTFAAAMPPQSDPAAPGYEVRLVLARSASNGQCGNIASTNIADDLAQGDVIVRGYVAGDVVNPEWDQADLLVGGATPAKLTRALSADKKTLDYTVQGPALAGADFWCFQVSENPLSDEATVTDGTQYATFAGALPAPNISGIAAGGVGTGSARVAAVVDPDGSPATAHVEYGMSITYGHRTAESAPATALSTLAVPLTGLRAGTTYHYRVVATSANGTTTSGDETFTTVAKLAVTGALRVGALVRCDTGSTGSGLTGYTWSRGGSAIAGAHAASYRLRSTDRGRAIRCSARSGSVKLTSPARTVPR